MTIRVGRAKFGNRSRRLSDPYTGWPAIVPGVTILEVARDHRSIFIRELPRLAGAVETFLKSKRLATPPQRQDGIAAE